MLHLVGLGLADEKDITVRGLEIVKKAERVYLEAYTAILLVDKAKLVSNDFCSFHVPISVTWGEVRHVQFAQVLTNLFRKPSMAAQSSRQTANW